MLSLLKPAPASARVAHERIDRDYKRLRWQVFTGIFVGYAAFYLVRKNFALAMPDILRDYPQYSKAQLGWALTGLSVAYGVSKFIMGSVSDRSNPRWFMTIGLLLTAGVTFAFGAIPAIYGSLAAIVILQTLNGWFNGMGWPPCGKTMVHWWSTKERGVIVSLWNVAHNVGGGLVAKLALVGVTAVPRLGREVLFPGRGRRAGRDRRSLSCYATRRRAAGFRPVEEYKNDYPPEYSAAHERTLTLQGNFLRLRAEQQVSLGDRGGERVRLFRALRRGGLDSDVSADGEGILVPAIELCVVRVRVCRHSRHDSVRLDVGQSFQGQPRAGDDPLHGADADRADRLWAESKRSALDRHGGADRASASLSTVRS